MPPVPVPDDRAADLVRPALGPTTRLTVHPQEKVPGEDLVSQFLRLSCLTYTPADGPDRWALARALLTDHPRLLDEFAVAVACCDVDRVRSALSSTPELARRPSGPWEQEPLVYLAYARHHEDLSASAATETMRTLLDAGADPNAGFLWDGLTPPFTVLTGLFAQGEQGAVRQPAHPHALALARLLLIAGADANDEQTLYNRMFEADDSHLRLLFEFGLGAGEGREPLREQLVWACCHGMVSRVRLLAEHGVDLRSPLRTGRTPRQLAALSGQTEVLDLLGELGVAGPPTEGAAGTVDDYVEAALRPDADRLAALEARFPELRAQTRRAQPALVLRAAAAGKPDAVRLLAGLGFDVNARGRQDLPIDEEWETALHAAAFRNDETTCLALLAVGADRTARDRRFDGTPGDWARHEGYDDLAELLDRTPDGGPSVG